MITYEFRLNNLKIKITFNIDLNIIGQIEI